MEKHLCFPSVTAGTCGRAAIKAACVGAIYLCCYKLLDIPAAHFLLYGTGILLGTAGCAFGATTVAILCQMLLVTPHWSTPFSLESVHTLSLGAFSAFLVCCAAFGKLAPRDRFPQGAVRPLFYGFIGCWVFGAAFKGAPGNDAVCWTMVLGAFFMAGKQAGTRVLPRFDREWRRNAVLLTASVAFAAAVVELGTRGLIPLPPSQLDLFRPSRQYLFTANPGGSSDFDVPLNDGTSKKMHHQFSRQGFRDRDYGPKEPGEYRILMLGDSFTEGTTVEEWNTIPKLLEAALAEKPLRKKVTVINAGLGGAGPLQELGMLRNYGLAMKPDLVVLQLFPDNDIENSLSVTGKHFEAYTPNMHEVMEVLREEGTVPALVEQWFRRHVHAYRVVQRIHERNYLLELLSATRYFPAHENAPLPPSVKRFFFFEADLTWWYPELEEGFDIMKKDILRLREECRAAGLPLVAYCIPKCNDIYTAIWERLAPEQKAPGLYDRGKALRLTEHFLRDEHFPMVSVLDALKANVSLGPVYYWRDGHLSEMGNAIVAEKLAEFLLENELKPLVAPQ